ncbi:unnamed protein product [Rotaria sp. Silwood1]|nr:unnamed protein product [Rotaria sp. Silwood1]CAF0939097.1 unnamed protein product [Rotaria sp. Silwood1]CAF3393541.1 unnamed protein product [Rotaria sp. Silwood1]CAF4789071.1 unnamed protein product [Rotaria sp. Silwood1]
MTARRIADARPWKEEIFGCCSDVNICCYGCFCTACLFGENVHTVNPDAGFCGACCCYCLTEAGCCCLVHKPARIRFREAYGLEEGHGLSGDLCASWCCSLCGVCQEAREIKIRGSPETAVIGGLPGAPISTTGNQSRTTLPATGALVTQPR